jgi:hypothetical protein
MHRSVGSPIARNTMAAYHPTKCFGILNLLAMEVIIEVDVDRLAAVQERSDPYFSLSSRDDLYIK